MTFREPERITCFLEFNVCLLSFASVDKPLTKFILRLVSRILTRSRFQSDRFASISTLCIKDDHQNYTLGHQLGLLHVWRVDKRQQ